MSSEQKNISCSLCHAYLFEEDDVVYCPVCGAPHHRECYNATGHCALEENHGTDRQYDKLKFQQEQEQEQQEFKKEEQETKNESEQSRFGGFNPNFEGAFRFDFLGGVPKDQPIDDGVTAEEAAKFVMSNTTRYIPKFVKLSKNHKVSWNFMAFLFPCGWFLSRKMYKNGIIAGLLNVAATLLTLPLSKSMYNLGIMDSVSYYDMAQKLMTNLPNIDTTLIFIAFIGMWISLAISLVCALFGDYLYKNHTVNTIKQIKAEGTDVEYSYRKKGGISLFLFFIGVLAVEYLPSIIATFI